MKLQDLNIETIYQYFDKYGFNGHLNDNDD